ncbi:MAG: 3-oxoacyl-ACP synthase III family protein [Candidatus Xenobium sp.]|jgi:3-oxoacyl-[acyl-carrier-protein] synthase-3
MMHLHGMGHFHPPNRLDNDFLTSLDIGTDESWILERVGIRCRRTVLDLDYIASTRNADPRLAGAASTHSNAQTGAAAARMALERAGLEPKDIGMVWAGGCSPQHTIPAEASKIAAELCIQAPVLDIGSACSTFAAQMHLAAGMRPESLPDYLLLISTENNTRTVDYRDRATAVLWGDGSSAAIVSPRVPSRMRVVHTTLASDPAGWDKVTIPTGGHFSQHGRAVQGFAIRRTAETLESLRSRSRRTPEHFHFIGHQANLLMLQNVCERCGIPPERHHFNVAEYGNTGAAGAPCVLSQNWEHFHEGDEIALVVVGSGLTWGGVLLEVHG